MPSINIIKAAKNFICADYRMALQNEFQNRKKIAEMLDVCDLEQDNLKTETKQLMERQTALEKTILGFNNTPFNPTIIPKRSIKYQRNVWLGEKKGWTIKAISVRNFITVNDDYYKDFLEQNDLFLTDLEQLDSFVPEIYKLSKKNYAYASDAVVGFSENWLFPFELETYRDNGIGGNCDQWANKIVTLMRIAGVPADRVFVACGTTRSGYGHATVSVRDSAWDWRNLNSTSPSFKFDDLKKYPSIHDKNDSVGIKEGGYWFSFNDAISISKFETEEAALLFKAETAMKKVLIE